MVSTFTELIILLVLFVGNGLFSFYMGMRKEQERKMVLPPDFSLEETLNPPEITDDEYIKNLKKSWNSYGEE